MKINCHQCGAAFERPRGTRANYCSAACRRDSANALQRKSYQKAVAEGRIVLKPKPLRAIDIVIAPEPPRVVVSPNLSSMPFRIYDPHLKITRFFKTEKKYLERKKELENQLI